MYCRSCSSETSDQAVMCVNCGAPPKSGTKYCQNCGNETNPAAVVCVNCGVKLAKGGSEDQKDWLVALLLCIFLGGLGIHRFYTGHTAIGIIQLLTLGLCGIWVIIDLILIITGSFKDANGQELVRK